MSSKCDYVIKLAQPTACVAGVLDPSHTALNDLETMKRAVPLLRSDFQAPSAPKVDQGHTHGIASCLPWYGSGCIGRESYRARSFIMPGSKGTTSGSVLSRVMM